MNNILLSIIKIINLNILQEQFSHYTYDNQVKQVYLLHTNSLLIFNSYCIYTYISYTTIQEVNDIIRTKEDLHKLRKEYDDLKLDMIQVIKYINF